MVTESQKVLIIVLVVGVIFLILTIILCIVCIDLVKKYAEAFHKRRKRLQRNIAGSFRRGADGFQRGLQQARNSFRTGSNQTRYRNDKSHASNEPDGKKRSSNHEIASSTITHTNDLGLSPPRRSDEHLKGKNSKKSQLYQDNSHTFESKNSSNNLNQTTALNHQHYYQDEQLDVHKSINPFTKNKETPIITNMLNVNGQNLSNNYDHDHTSIYNRDQFKGVDGPPPIVGVRMGQVNSSQHDFTQSNLTPASVNLVLNEAYCTENKKVAQNKMVHKSEHENPLYGRNTFNSSRPTNKHTGNQSINATFI